MSKLCVICLNSKRNLRNISETNKDNIQIVISLRKCVPEVEWKTEFSLCNDCLKQLERACAFRELCIRSYLSRKELDDDDDVVKVEQSLSDLDGFNKSNSDCENFICFHCKKLFKLKNLLAKHIRNEHGRNRKATFTCGKCQKQYTKESYLGKHLKICQNDKDVKNEINDSNICDICGTSFSNKYLLKRHLRNVHATEKKFKCELCDRKFASPVYLNAHKRYHSGERKHICSFCGKGYITASDLYHHEKIHANKRAYRCEICPKAFNTSSDLHKHKICVHLDRSQWKYECTYCQRRFPLKTNLDTHTKTHTGERNFHCHLCDRKCINRSVLKRHIESHSIVKSFKCSLCLQSYKYQKSLDLHLAKSHGVGDIKIPERQKKFFCNYCPKSYFANSKLQKHIRSHTGERPFKCFACDKCFSDKTYAKHHMKLHGIENHNFSEPVQV